MAEKERNFTEKGNVPSETIGEKLNVLKKTLKARCNRKVKATLKKVVPTYKNPEDVNKAVG